MFKSETTRGVDGVKKDVQVTDKGDWVERVTDRREEDDLRDSTQKYEVWVVLY